MKKELSIKILKKVLEYLNMNPKQLSDSIGKERAQWAYDVLNPNKPVGISKDIADRISNRYPEISKSYLLTGEGDMLKPDAGKQEQGTTSEIAEGAAVGATIGAVAASNPMMPGISSSLLKLLSQYDEALSAERNMREREAQEKIRIKNENERLRLEIQELKSKLT